MERDQPGGWFELSGTEQVEKGRARVWDCLRVQRRRSWKEFSASAELRRPKIPAGIPELVSRSFSGGCNGKQQPRISSHGHVRAGLGQSRGSHELLLWQIPAPRGTSAREFPWKPEQSSWNVRGEVDAGMERGRDIQRAFQRGRNKVMDLTGSRAGSPEWWWDPPGAPAAPGSRAPTSPAWNPSPLSSLRS